MNANLFLAKIARKFYSRIISSKKLSKIIISILVNLNNKILTQDFFYIYIKFYIEENFEDDPLTYFIFSSKDKIEVIDKSVLNNNQLPADSNNSSIVDHNLISDFRGCVKRSLYCKFCKVEIALILQSIPKNVEYKYIDKIIFSLKAVKVKDYSLSKSKRIEDFDSNKCTTQEQIKQFSEQKRLQLKNYDYDVTKENFELDKGTSKIFLLLLIYNKK